jgi:hypothetical protein
MASIPAVPAAPGPAGALTKDPVRWTWVLYGLVQAVITILLATEAISNDVGAIITGIALALYVAVSELYTRPETVPRAPLEALAAAQADDDLQGEPDDDVREAFGDAPDA